MIKNSWKIFIDDLKNIRTNIVTVIVLSGLIFLPSLYAWFNISASWDPYSQTDQLPVGIVNEDQGVHIRGEDIVVGDEVVAALQENTALNWQFIDANTAMAQLNKGDLFAVIVIPENFSEHLGSVLEKQPEKATIEYYVNEKINAIAPKITEKGASVIVDNITKQFITTINGIVFNFFHEIGLELEAELPDIERLEQYVFTLEEQLPNIELILVGSLGDIERADELLIKLQSEIPTVENAVSQGIGSIDRVTKLLNDIEKNLDTIIGKIETGTEKATKNFKQLTDSFATIKDNKADFTDGISHIKDLQDEMIAAGSTIENIITVLEDLLERPEIDALPDEQKDSLQSLVDELTTIKDILLAGEKQIGEMIAQTETYDKEIDQMFSTIESATKTMTKELEQLLETFTQSIAPTVQTEIKKTRTTLQNAHTVLTNVQSNLPGVKGMLQRTQEHLEEGKHLLEDVLAEYPFVYEKTVQLADQIRDLQADLNIYEIIEILKNEPNTDKGFLAEPVLLTENKVFPIKNYGTGMTPFYTLLSLWVGGILLISILATNVLEPEKFAPKEIYFGKLYLFLLIGCLQTLIVTLGDIFLLKVQIANPFLFVLFGLLCSVVFMTLIYTFASLFGNVGKALAIIMLVLQIAGSGGTYPVALLPKFFQAISPFLPFTYAVGLMREAVGGIVWSNVFLYSGVLIGIGLFAIIIGAFLKRIVNELANKFMGESEDSGIFQ